VQVYEVYPGVEPDDTYRRLIEVDGKPRERVELDKDERRRQKHVLDALDERRREDSAAREKRLERETKAHHQDDDTLDDLLRVYQFTLVARQTLDGHPVIVIDFVPRPDAAPKTSDWKGHDEGQGARLGRGGRLSDRPRPIEVIEDFSVRWFVGRLAGTTASYSAGRSAMKSAAVAAARQRVGPGADSKIPHRYRDGLLGLSEVAVQTDTEFHQGSGSDKTRPGVGLSGRLGRVSGQLGVLVWCQSCLEAGRGANHRTFPGDVCSPLRGVAVAADPVPCAGAPRVWVAGYALVLGGLFAGK
jgi:hypothetical protein